MQAGAARIALSNPRLTRFKIAFLQPLRSARGRVAPSSPQPTRAVEKGTYVPVRDAYGIPVSMLASETWYRFGGLGPRMTRHSVCELRPSGHPDAARKSWKKLLVEKSPAGEEARVLVFACWLLILAVWGILRGMMSGAVVAPTTSRSRGLVSLEH